MSAPKQHARIAFSSLARTVQCPGSVVMCEQYPGESTDEADEGTEAHRLALQAATGCIVGGDDDMQRGADLWREYVRAAGGGLLEVPTQATAIHATDCWGTPDFRGYDAASNRLRVGDYKYGFGEVDAVGNYQLIAGAIATVDELGLPAEARATLVCELTIVQPRGYHGGGPVKTWTVPLTDLMHYVAQARAAAFDALGPNPRLRRGPECTYCPARHACPELQNHGYAAYDYGRRAEPNELTPAQLGVELAMMEDTAALLDARIRGLMAQADHAVRAGHTVNGYGLKAGRSNLAWIDAESTLAMFPQLAQTVKPITPTQAISGKLLPAEVVDALATRPPASMKLTRINATKVFAR